MPVVVALLRGINIGGHHKIRMDALRDLCESLGWRDVRTHIQSGNVVFKTQARDLARLAGRLEGAIEQRFGFRPAVMLRSAGELRSVVARNPFGGRQGVDGAKLAVTFLSSAPGADARDCVARMKTDPEEVRLDGREMYVHFPNGQGRANLTFGAIEKALKVAGTIRNWNTVTKLVAMAEELETSR
jgi:uncharacterized protein (DUF1697 family)